MNARQIEKRRIRQLAEWARENPGDAMALSALGFYGAMAAIEFVKNWRAKHG